MPLKCTRCKAMTNCTQHQYWDKLLCQCISCGVACNRPTVERCIAFCASMECSKQAGFYYDELLRNCINCSAVCGQHPSQCLPFCGNKPVTTSSTMAAQEQKPGSDQDQWLVVYLLLGLCLCTVICSLLLGWTHFKRRGTEVSCQPAPGTCHKREDSSKDHLVEAGSVGGGSTGSRVAEPVETCGFCFREQGPAMQETKPCHSPFYHLGARAAPSQAGIPSTGSAGAIPAPEDGHFKIICSPSQEKTLMT
ncbi:tumor necrosis factor receptor superfamily member 13B [Carettochelys insculpta]|uniref:tumor necrosis factor receptor superfamily member 13B n=1 Tax=Carettochelys insculpta TaxID=44489 RepID=UPI003EC0A65D